MIGDDIKNSILNMSDADLSELRDVACDEIIRRYVSKAKLNSNPELNDDEQALFNEGDRLECVRRYRQRTGAGLKEAIDVTKYFQSR